MQTSSPHSRVSLKNLHQAHGFVSGFKMSCPPSSSILAAKPPQRPESTPDRKLPVRTPTNNYLSALAERDEAVKEGNTAEASSEVDEGQVQGQSATPASPSSTWKPSFNRTQSWSEQDFKHENQEGLWREGERPGFSEKSA